MKKTSKENWIEIIKNNPPELIADLILRDAKEIHDLRKGRAKMSKDLAEERKKNCKAIEYIEKASYLQGNKILEEKELLKILKGEDKQ